MNVINSRRLMLCFKFSPQFFLFIFDMPRHYLIRDYSSRLCAGDMQGCHLSVDLLQHDCFGSVLGLVQCSCSICLFLEMQYFAVYNSTASSQQDIFPCNVSYVLIKFDNSNATAFLQLGFKCAWLPARRHFLTETQCREYISS